MTITTKFNLNDLIYFLYEGKVWTRKITCVKAETDIFGTELEIKYFVNVGLDVPGSSFKSHILKESEAFETREQLIESL